MMQQGPETNTGAAFEDTVDAMFEDAPSSAEETSLDAEAEQQQEDAAPS